MDTGPNSSRKRKYSNSGDVGFTPILSLKRDLTEIEIEKSNKDTSRRSPAATNRSNASSKDNQMNNMRIGTPKSDRGLYSSAGNYTKVDLLLPDVSNKKFNEE